MRFFLLSSRILGFCRWVGVAAWVCATLSVHAQSVNTAAEFRVKAAFIYNFAKYVEWPVVDTKEFHVCSAGRDDLGGALFALDRRSAQGREIRIKHNLALDQLKDCQIVFVSERDNKLLNLVVRQFANAPVLIVSDNPQAVDVGAHITLASAEDRVEFDVNLPMLQRANLKASSQMLKLARNTKPAKL